MWFAPLLCVVTLLFLSWYRRPPGTPCQVRAPDQDRKTASDCISNLPTQCPVLEKLWATERKQVLKRLWSQKPIFEKFFQITQLLYEVKLMTVFQI